MKGHPGESDSATPGTSLSAAGRPADNEPGSAEQASASNAEPAGASSPGLRATMEITAALLKRQIERQMARAAAPTVATRDHDVIRRWAERCGGEPATGQATTSGPATVDVNDGGAAVRFNFPGAAPFRPIPWAEWFEDFERHRLVFVFEEGQSNEAPRGACYLLIDERAWQRSDLRSGVR